MRILAIAVMLTVSVPVSVPAAARDRLAPDTLHDTEDSAFEGDYLSIGVGGGYGPSYDGSDDYVAFPGVIIRGSLGGVGFSPRGAGIALDFWKDGDGPVGVDLGIVMKVRSNRAGSIKDPVVLALGKLDRAIEVGPTFGLDYKGLFNPYDGISIGTDVLWDISGAHSGMVIDPSISYVTPLSRGIAAQISIGAQYADAKFNDYYYSVTPAQSLASGLPVFEAGAGFTKAGIRYAMGFDLNGDIEDGGFALVVLGSYNQMLGDAKRSPFTQIRGDDDQWLGAMGVGYTF